MKHVILGLLLGLLAAYPHLGAPAAAAAEAVLRWLLTLPAVTAPAVAYATVRGLRAHPWPVRKGGPR
jgi:hypothetical protein